MASEMNPTHLLIEELNYELRIRGVVSNRSQDEKRKILRRLLERQKKSQIVHFSDPLFSFITEQNEINSTLESITQLVIEFEGNKEDSTFKRAKSRLSHVSDRISRLPINKGAEDEQERVSFKNESFAACISLEADLYDKITNELPVVDNATCVSKLTDSSTSHGISDYSQCLTGRSQPKSIPVYKWGETFSGDRATLDSFLENVQELRKARYVSKVELFESARDLFTGDARCWFRQVIVDVNDWDSLVEALKRDFRSPYHDDELWDNIKCRVQLREEPVVIYFARMNELFGQLTRAPVESTKLKFIRNGLIPQYRKALAMVEISSVSELYRMVKRLEDGDYLEIEEPHNKKTNSPDLHSKNSRKGPFKFKKTNVEQIDSRTSSRLSSVDNQNDNNSRYRTNLECWNCRRKGHFYSECRSKKVKFCYRCGLSNVTVNTCTRCQKN